MFSISLDEILMQLALGTLDPSIYPEIYHISDRKILTILAFCSDVILRRAAAVNPNTPFDVHYKQYMADADQLVKECAWEHTKLRYIRRFHRIPISPFQMNLDIDPYDIPE